MSTAEEVAAALTALLADRGVQCRVTVTGRATVGLSQETWFARLTHAAAGGGAEVGSAGEAPVGVVGVAGVPGVAGVAGAGEAGVVQGAAGGASGEDVVIRLPTGASGHGSMQTQQAALQAVAGTDVPAPRIRWSEQTAGNPFGAPVIVMERLHGEVPAGWHELAPGRRIVLAHRTVEAMAALHALEPDRAPDLRRPRGTPAEDALTFHRRRFEGLGYAEDPVLKAAMWWLQRHLPATRPTAIVHHDLRMGNLVVDEDRLVGILDWELAAIGDPHSDVVWCFVAVWEPPGLDAAPLYDRYAEAAGVDLDEGILHWELVMAYLRLAYYAASGATAFRTGVSSDLRLAALAHLMPIQLDRLTAAIAGDPIG